MRDRNEVPNHPTSDPEPRAGEAGPPGAWADGGEPADPPERLGNVFLNRAQSDYVSGKDAPPCWKKRLPPIQNSGLPISPEVSLSIGKSGPDSPPAALPEARSRAHRLAAIDHLRACFELGWTDFAYVDDESWFDPIRSDPAFQSLVAIWRKKAGK